MKLTRNILEAVINDLLVDVTGLVDQIRGIENITKDDKLMLRLSAIYSALYDEQLFSLPTLEAREKILM